MTSRSRLLREGVIAGLIGATIVAVWFLVYDAARGRPLRTPALLGAATFQGVAEPASVATTPGLVAQYTVLHGVVFALVGVLIAYLIMAVQREPGRLLLLVIALLCFEVAFLAAVVTLARPVLGEVAWWAMLVGNALAAAGMLAWLLVGYRALGRHLRGPWTGVVREGVVGGLVGAAVVAVWFLLYDVAAGAPLRTPALLGAALLEGLRDPATLRVTPALVLGYTVLHGVAFVAFGLAAAGLLALADREPRVLFALFMLFCCFEVFFVVLVVALAEWLLEALAWWTILAGNLLAAVAMVAYFLRNHRSAWRQFLTAGSG